MARRDIQGLRALAVVAVVGDHVLGAPQGGFLGVDVFFVISGFLITGLLLREYHTSGRIDLRGFYRRRIKRTLPVAWFVLVVILVCGAWTLTGYGFAQLVPGVLSAGTFWSNWHLIGIGTDYLHATDAPLAVQHYWSLAVEEQFYLVWPVVLIGALALAKGRRLRGVPIAVALLIAGGSLVWAAVETQTHATAAYFSTFTRGWELLAGAALAFSTPALARIPDVIRPWLAWAGLLLLLWSFVKVSPDFAFPYPWAASAVVGTVLVIGAGSGGSDTQVWPLTNPVAQYLGLISYSVYLWHFPVVVFTEALRPETGTVAHVVELLLIVVLSVLSFHLIEKPLRRARWRRPVLGRPSRRAVLGVGAGVLTVVTLAGALVTTRHTPPVDSVETTPYFPVSASTAEAERQAAIEDAVHAPGWPALTPDDATLTAGAQVTEWLKGGCLNAFGPEETARRCVFGDPAAPRTAIVFGDSVALSYVPSVRAALDGRGWRIEVLTNGQCPAIDITVALPDGSPFRECDAYRAWALQRIAAEHPALVIASSSYLSLTRLASGRINEDAMVDWAASTRRTVTQLSKSADRVLLLDAPPIQRSPTSCRTPISRPADCLTGVPNNWKQAADAQRSGMVAAAEANVDYPSTLPWFCTRAGLCPPFVGHAVTLADGMHLTDAGALALMPLMRDAIDHAVRGLRPAAPQS